MAAAAALCLMPGMAATSQGWKRYREAVGGRREPREPAPTPAAPILPRRRRQLPRRSARAKAAENATALAAALKRAKQAEERQAKLLPSGTWCHKGTCQFPHGPDVPCTADPDYVGETTALLRLGAGRGARA